MCGLETIAIVSGLLAGMVAILDLALRIKARQKRRANGPHKQGGANDRERPLIGSARSAPSKDRSSGPPCEYPAEARRD